MNFATVYANKSIVKSSQKTKQFFKCVLFYRGQNFKNSNKQEICVGKFNDKFSLLVKICLNISLIERFSMRSSSAVYANIPSGEKYCCKFKRYYFIFKWGLLQIRYWLNKILKMPFLLIISYISLYCTVIADNC